MQEKETAMRRHKHTFATLILASSSLVMLQSAALGAGFAIRETSAAGQGVAFAGGAAGGFDISAMAANPAIMGLFPGSHIQAVTSYILPQTEMRDAEATFGAALPIIGGAPVPGATSSGDITPNALVPAGYASYMVRPDLFFGIAVTAPFGLESEYPGNWVGRFHAINSSLETININPAVSFQPFDGVWLGAGPVIQYISADLTNATFVPGGPGLLEGLAELEGDDVAAGFTAGIVVEVSDSTRVGASYRSEIEHTLAGDVSISVDGATVLSSPGRANVSTPAIAQFSIIHELNDQWTLLASAEWTEWSVFDALVVNADGLPTTTTTTDWNDTWFFSAGAQYRLNDDWAFRGGAGYDQSPIDDEFRGPRIPDADRFWLSLGASWQVAQNIAIDAGYTHVFVNEESIFVDASLAENATRGGLSAVIDPAIDIVAVSARFTW